MSHQNGLDADVYYPRRDGRERARGAPRMVDQRLSQDLVDRFVAAGARYVFTGPSLSLRGPRRIVRSSPTTTTTCTCGCPERAAAAAQAMEQRQTTRSPARSSAAPGSSKRRTLVPADHGDHGRRGRVGGERPASAAVTSFSITSSPCADVQQVLQHRDDARAPDGLAEQPPGGAGGHDHGVRAALLEQVGVLVVAHGGDDRGGRG